MWWRRILLKRTNCSCSIPYVTIVSIMDWCNDDVIISGLEECCQVQEACSKSSKNITTFSIYGIITVYIVSCFCYTTRMCSKIAQKCPYMVNDSLILPKKKKKKCIMTEPGRLFPHPYAGTCNASREGGMHVSLHQPPSAVHLFLVGWPFSVLQCTLCMPAACIPS